MPRFSSTGLRQRPAFFSREKVLHVAGAYLDHVSVVVHQRQRFAVDGLAHDAQPEVLANLRHDLERVFSQSLEGVGRSSRLECTAAEELCSRIRHCFCDRKRLLTRLDSARPGDDRQVASANGGVGTGKADDGVFFLGVAAHQLVGFRDADHLGDALQRFNVAAIHLTLIAGNADGSALRAGQGMGAIPKRLNVIADCLDLFRTCLRLHDYEHFEPSFNTSISSRSIFRTAISRGTRESGARRGARPATLFPPNPGIPAGSPT